jgi:polysaccharide deacetylase family protein (PEP-CTERM system associated)
MINALTIDVEDYFQVSNFEHLVKKNDWDKYECRVVNNTRRILDILSANSTNATFFVLGWVAERFPELIREIDSKGHEIASHGYWHKLVYDMTKDEFKNDLVRSIQALEKVTGKKVLGYRAPSCSITKNSLWAIDILKECGIKYDSSVFPIYHGRCGIPSASRFIYKWYDSGIPEFPFSTIKLLKNNIPVAGGGYFRLYPYWLTKWAISEINKSNSSAMVYIHPWEIDPEQPRMAIRGSYAFRHYVNLKHNEAKIKKLLRDFKFCTIESILKSSYLI